MLSTIINGILIVALLAYVGYRQSVWRPVSIPQMWKRPALFAIIGLVVLVQQLHGASLTPVDVGLVIGELLLTLGAGAWMGAMAHFRPLPHPIRLGRDGRYIATVESRTGIFGLVLWGAIIVIRVGIDIAAAHMGSHLAGATGMIFLIFAANRAARVWVLSARLARSTPTLA